MLVKHEVMFLHQRLVDKFEKKHCILYKHRLIYYFIEETKHPLTKKNSTLGTLSHPIENFTNNWFYIKESFRHFHKNR